VWTLQCYLLCTTKYGSTELISFKKQFVFVTLWAFLHCEMVVNHQPRSMFCCCSFLTGWNLLPVLTAEKNFEDVANMHVLVQSSTAWISPPPATISVCHADRTECDHLSFSDQMMRHNRLSGSRLLSSSGMTVFNDFTAFNALSQWTSLTTDGIRHRPTGFHWRIVVKLGVPA